MKFLSTLLAVAVSSSLASALTFTNRNFYNIKPGTAFNITWDDAAGPVTLTLLEGGTPGYLEPVATLASESISQASNSAYQKAEVEVFD